MDYTEYSKIIKGNKGNYYLSVRFDYTTGGYVGISQFNENLIERILLNKNQIDGLIRFYRLKQKNARQKTIN